MERQKTEVRRKKVWTADVHDYADFYDWNAEANFRFCPESIKIIISHGWTRSETDNFLWTKNLKLETWNFKP